jgi:hypothetical protein
MILLDSQEKLLVRAGDGRSGCSEPERSQPQGVLALVRAQLQRTKIDMISLPSPSWLRNIPLPCPYQSKFRYLSTVNWGTEGQIASFCKAKKKNNIVSTSVEY